MNAGRKRAFTLIEVLAAVVLLGVGIVAVLSALSSLTGAEARMRETERMLRLAQTKYDELVATSEQLNSPQSGNFEEQGEPNFTWSSEVEPTGVENLDAITVTVTKRNSDKEVETSGLIFVPPLASGATP